MILRQKGAYAVLGAFTDPQDKGEVKQCLTNFLTIQLPGPSVGAYGSVSLGYSLRAWAFYSSPEKSGKQWLVGKEEGRVSTTGESGRALGPYTAGGDIS